MRFKFPAEILIPLVSVHFIWKQESPQDDFNWAAKFPRGEGGCTHLGHKACRWPLRDIASRARVKHLLISTLYPFGRLSWKEKWGPFFKSGLYSTFSNSTIMNKYKQVSHSMWLRPRSITNETRRCGSVYLGVVVLYVWEVCYVYEGYVGSVVVLCIWGVS